MTIERFDLLPREDCHCELADTAFGVYVLFADAEADKAEAVAEAVAAAKAKEPGICAICEKEIFWFAFEHDGRPGSWQHGGDFGFDHKATPRGEAEAVAEAVEKATAEMRVEVEDLQQKLQHMVATKQCIDASVSKILKIKQPTTATEPSHIPPTSLARSIVVERNKTAELRAELVALLTRPILLHAPIKDDGCYHVRKFSEDHINCERLVELGVWEAPGSMGKFVRYQPIEPQSSGGKR